MPKIRYPGISSDRTQIQTVELHTCNSYIKIQRNAVGAYISDKIYVLNQGVIDSGYVYYPDLGGTGGWEKGEAPSVVVCEVSGQQEVRMRQVP